MTKVNSRTLAVEPDAPVYVTSAPEGSEWGQPEASQYVFSVKGTRLIGEPINGTYIVARSATPPGIDPVLLDEFRAWDAASDEALSNFEASLKP